MLKFINRRWSSSSSDHLVDVQLFGYCFASFFHSDSPSRKTKIKRDIFSVSKSRHAMEINAFSSSSRFCVVRMSEQMSESINYLGLARHGWTILMKHFLFSLFVISRDELFLFH